MISFTDIARIWLKSQMVPVEQSEDAEDWWIYYLLDLGHPLFNVRDGKGRSLAKYKRAVLWWWNGWD